MGTYVSLEKRDNHPKAPQDHFRNNRQTQTDKMLRIWTAWNDCSKHSPRTHPSVIRKSDVEKAKAQERVMEKKSRLFNMKQLLRCHLPVRQLSLK